MGGQTPAACSSGYYSYAGDGVCSICPAGYRCPDATVQPILCEPGQYNLPGKITCTTCPEGHFCVDPTSTPSICPQGQWAPAGSSMCSNCPLGFKCDNSIMWSPGTASTSRTACSGTTSITSEFHEACYVSYIIRLIINLGMSSWLCVPLIFDAFNCGLWTRLLLNYIDELLSGCKCRHICL